MKKALFLFFALLLPVLVFIFLKMFGRNEFDINVYYVDGVGRELSGCAPYATPYLVDTEKLNAIGWTGSKAAVIVLQPKAVKKNLVKVAEEFQEGDYETLTVDSATYELKTCTLLAADTASVVLVDAQRRIRGYYHPELRDEADRLTVELKILLRKY